MIQMWGVRSGQSDLKWGKTSVVSLQSHVLKIHDFIFPTLEAETCASTAISTFSLV